jgi:hypothetical protein
VRDPAALPLAKSPWYSMDRRLGVPECKCGRCEENENIFLLLEIARFAYVYTVCSYKYIV